MAELQLRGLRKRYDGGAEVLRGVDLDIADGEFMVFVGPSGCGKSTLLRMIAGLEAVSEGEIRIGGRSVGALDPAQRGVAMVFQSYALYPHMTVEQNMGFALKMAGERSAVIRERVGQVAEVLQIGPLLQRKPRELSGGQRQRVAIGRAIVRRPAVFLFDEPLSNLDASLRVQMRIELSRLHQELGTTMVYVTHDQVEAMTLGDRIAVFNGGRIEQVGAPLALFDRPQSLFVAGFLGTPRMNLLPVSCSEAPGGGGRLALGSGSLDLPGCRPGPLTLGVRAEHIELTHPGAGIRARIELVEHLGDAVIVHARLVPSQASVAIRRSPQQPCPAAGDEVGLLIRPDSVHLFDESGQALAAR